MQFYSLSCLYVVKQRQKLKITKQTVKNFSVSDHFRSESSRTNNHRRQCRAQCAKQSHTYRICEFLTRMVHNDGALCGKVVIPMRFITSKVRTSAITDFLSFPLADGRHKARNATGPVRVQCSQHLSYPQSDPWLQIIIGFPRRFHLRIARIVCGLRQVI